MRPSLIEALREEFAATASLTGCDRPSPRVLAALDAVPRARFVPPGEADLAEENIALPIGHGQTISQPFIVALMTELLDPAPEHRVLEIGTGSGYQAAILGRLAREVHSLEVVPELAARARATLAAIGAANVHVHDGDGHAGLPDHAPFDRVIVTAATADIPAALLAQLSPGGRLVAPIGRADEGQDLTVLDKDATGRVQRRVVLPVRFVPMVGRDARPAHGKS